MHDTLKSHILHLLQKDGTPRQVVHLQDELGAGGNLRTAFREALARTPNRTQSLHGLQQASR